MKFTTRLVAIIDIRAPQVKLSVFRVFGQDTIQRHRVRVHETWGCPGDVEGFAVGIAEGSVQWMVVR
jgi:hypothetical protein